MSPRSFDGWRWETEVWSGYKFTLERTIQRTHSTRRCSLRPTWKFENTEKGILSIGGDCQMDQKSVGRNCPAPPYVPYPDACSDASSAQMQVQKKLIVSPRYSWWRTIGRQGVIRAEKWVRPTLADGVVFNVNGNNFSGCPSNPRRSVWTCWAKSLSTWEDGKNTYILSKKTAKDAGTISLR